MSLLKRQRLEPSLTTQSILVSCPRNSRYIAGGQLAVFQGGPSRTGGKAPISESFDFEGRADNRVRTDDLLITNQLLYQLSYVGFVRRCANGIIICPSRPNYASEFST